MSIDLVLAETDFLIRSRLGRRAAGKFVEQLVAGALFREKLSSADLGRAAEILHEYEDQDFGLTDASLMAVAERLGAPVLTLDRRHFEVFRDRKGGPLVLLPHLVSDELRPALIVRGPEPGGQDGSPGTCSQVHPGMS